MEIMSSSSIISSAFINSAFVNKIKENPKENAVPSINLITQLIAGFNTEYSTSAEYKKLYSQLEHACIYNGIEITSEDNQAKELEKFLDTDHKNIFFLIESLTGPSAICALLMYDLYYEKRNYHQLLDYSKMKADLLLRDVYATNGGNARSFAITTATYFLKNYNYDSNSLKNEYDSLKNNCNPGWNDETAICLTPEYDI